MLSKGKICVASVDFLIFRKFKTTQQTAKLFTSRILTVFTSVSASPSLTGTSPSPRGMSPSPQKVDASPTRVRTRTRVFPTLSAALMFH